MPKTRPKQSVTDNSPIFPQTYQKLVDFLDKSSKEEAFEAIWQDLQNPEIYQRIKGPSIMTVKEVKRFKNVANDLLVVTCARAEGGKPFVIDVLNEQEIYTAKVGKECTEQTGWNLFFFQSQFQLNKLGIIEFDATQKTYGFRKDTIDPDRWKKIYGFKK